MLAIALMTMMIAVGLAAFSFVDTQQEMSMKERQRESSFNLAEAVLNSSFTLCAAGWRLRRRTRRPCRPARTQRLPRSSAPTSPSWAPLAQLDDYAAGATWKTSIYDDPGGDPFYDAAVVEAPTNPHWDSNGNLRVWVKSETGVRKRKRVLVALIQVTENVEFLPTVILAGQFELTPNGNGVYIKTNPDATSEQ